MVRASDCPHPVPGFTIDAFDDEAILFHPATLSVLRLNRCAALVWQLCDGHRSIADVCGLLASAYPESAEQINHDVERTLRMLEEGGALVVSRERSDGQGTS